MNISFGKMLVFTGIVLMVIGALLIFSGKIPWLGKLPGDIYIQKKDFSLYFPITTSIMISVILSLVLMLIRKR
ncbi:MAG: DUF2905 domain-containing protein [Candidatus Omnitrophica bacterium]|nr:DUF2905 domain-containing protein [Candidatus Omnitrophota bacterium]